MQQKNPGPYLEDLSNRREKLGITRKKLGDAVGVTENTIKGVETGRFACDIDLHIRLYEALKLNTVYETNRISPP